VDDSDAMPESVSRRRMVRNGLALVLGAVGIGAAACTSEAKPKGAEAAKGDGSTLKLSGRGWHANLYKPGEGVVAQAFSAHRGDNVVMWGKLVHAGGDDPAGAFYASCSVVYAPLSDDPAANFEQHSFNLTDGTILGMGTVSANPKDDPVFAIVGGTGKYAGARGTYTARCRPIELGGDGTADFDLTLL
jgi:hypothetical protein